MNLNIPPFPTNDTPPDAIRISLLRKDEVCREAMAAAKLARKAGVTPVKAKKTRKGHNARKSGQMDVHVYLSAFEVTK
jgi:hypothetical protein